MNEEPFDPIMDYFREIFSSVHTNEFLDSLNDEQKKYLFPFITGFESCLRHSIVGVYGWDYIKSKNFTNDVLKTLAVNCQSFYIKDIELKFVIAWQWIGGEEKKEGKLDEHKVETDVENKTSSSEPNTECERLGNEQNETSTAEHEFG